MDHAFDPMRNRRGIRGKEAGIETPHSAGRRDRAGDEEKTGWIWQKPRFGERLPWPVKLRGVPSVLRPKQSPVSSQASRIAAMASERAREGVILGLPFRRFRSRAVGIGAATGTRLSVLSTRPPGKTN